jgi:hypothetical protein
MSTYTVPHLYNSTVGLETAHVGVGPHTPGHDEQRYHYYYQWVPFALFFQALSFLIPHFLWKAFEEGRIKAYCTMELAPKIALKSRAFISEADAGKKQMKLDRAAVYFVGSQSFNKSYAYFYIICEIMNFVLIILNFVFTNAFLGSNNFNNYGPEVVSFLGDDPESDMSPMNRVFPKVAKCDFHKYGPSGNLIRYDIMCVLALNIINEKVYVFLWFWFIITAIIAGIWLIVRLALLFLPRVRNTVLRRKVSRNHKEALDEVLHIIGYADWFVLNLLSDNLNALRFGELCESIRTAFYKRQDIREISARSSPSPSPPPKYPSEKEKADDNNDSYPDSNSDVPLMRA